MSGSRPTPAEQHLGDRLSALVDGELGHEARERVLAHLATCAKCKAEADEQRRLKNVFAEAAPPPPSESFLARLQGLPGGSDGDGGGSRLGGGGFGSSGLFGVKPEPFEYVPSGPHASMLPSEQHGFRIHDISRRDADRSASRGLRFAFVAAGAVSLAAIALGGVTTGVPADTTDARGGPSGSGSNVTPMRTQGTAGAMAPESQRRRGTGPLLAQGQRSFSADLGTPTEAAAPLMPGAPQPVDQGMESLPELTTPVVAGAAAMSPLIRPLSTPPPVTLTSWSTASEFATSGLPAVPMPDSSASAAPPPSR
ncbi:anti-sigma factor family protein [Streptomyces sporangiiformans]|uniref:Zf-HC2 domain-containing protein n=1 Tax=Streptomyces sporangiiformans TaxID=2315329 RepID=A0A505D1L2_9ACTN|nr:anti-sigma factor [Streptomyces sporangiiformans]TPQ16062.1 zf-HC2 domain-containing protein [Streptomyces sporangiiformans]